MTFSFVRGAWRRLPVESLCVAIAAGSAIHLVHEGKSVWAIRLLLAALVIAPLAFASHGLGRRLQLALGALVAALVVALLAAIVPTADTVSHPTFAWPYGLSLLAAAMVPFIAAARRFAAFARRFFEQTTTFALLWAGALAALGVVSMALHELFSLSTFRYFDDAALLTAGALVLELASRLLDDADGRVPDIWRRLATTIGAPFVAVMLVILAGYEITVLWHRELPRNMLSPLILAAGFIGF